MSAADYLIATASFVGKLRLKKMSSDWVADRGIRSLANEHCGTIVRRRALTTCSTLRKPISISHGAELVNYSKPTSTYLPSEEKL